MLKKKLIIVIVVILLLIIGSTNSKKSQNTSNDTTIETTNISKFNYNINDTKLTLEKYKGNDNSIIISDTYTIDGINYTVNNISHTIFNGCTATKIYIPKTIECVYDDTLAYLNKDHIDIYYEGTEEEWNSIFTKYEASSAKEEWNNGNAEKAGKALADKLNAKIGHTYNPEKFTYHYNSNINNIDI